MLANKNMLYGLIIVGLVLALLSVLIDPIRGYDLYLALPQIIGLIVGIVLLLVGAYLLFVRRPPTAV
jgi:hypothetical protein